MFRSRAIRIVAAAATSVLILSPLAASASVVRDGFYVGTDSDADAPAYFHVKHDRVYHLRFTLTLSCHNSSTGNNYPRYFTAGSAMPQGRSIPANGTFSIDWSQEDGGRHGRIHGELGFHRHGRARFSVTSTGGLEHCTGSSAVPLTRASRTPPVPSAP
jgi:hypothetical protein